MVKAQNKIIRRKNKVFKTIEGKTYILDEKTDNFYTLNETASFIWQKISRPTSFDKLVDSLAKEFRVARVRTQRDLEELLLYLTKKGLITTKTKSKIS